MPFEDEFIDYPSKNAKRRCPGDRVKHHGSVFTISKFVNVFKGSEIALDHLVYKKPRPFELNNFYRHPLTKPEMFPFEGNRLVEPDISFSDARDDFLVRSCDGLRVKPDVSHKVETPFGGGIYHGFEDYLRHRIKNSF